MNIVVTGATGFIGKNLCERLEATHTHIIMKANSVTKTEQLENYLKDCDILYNLAAVHRPKDPSEFEKVNVDYFRDILITLECYNPECRVVSISSIQAGNGSSYGNSKVAAEELLKEYKKKTGSIVHLLRLTNCFGKYARINAHSVVATFCYNISHDLPIRIDSPDAVIRLCYIDDVVDLLISYMDSEISSFSFFPERLIHPISIGALSNLLYTFQKNEYTVDSLFAENLLKTYNWYKNQI